MNIRANHCSYLINFNYVIGQKKILMSFLDTSINMHCVWRYSNVDRYWWKRNHFYLIKVTRPRNGTVVLTKVVTFWLTAIFVLRHPRIQCFIACFTVLKYEIEVGKNWTNNETCFPIFWHEWSISPELWLIEAATVTGSGFNQSRIYSRMAISVHVLKPGRRSIL